MTVANRRQAAITNRRRDLPARRRPPQLFGPGDNPIASLLVATSSSISLMSTQLTRKSTGEDELGRRLPHWQPVSSLAVNPAPG